MKVSELLEQVDTMVPNALPVKIKVAWFNAIQNQLYRDYPLPDSVFHFHVHEDEQIYSLPDNCPEDRITKLVVGDNEVPYIPLIEVADTDRFWTIVAGHLMIAPNPIERAEAFLYYRPRPKQMAADDLEAKCDFPEDYQELLILGCSSRIAKTGKDTLELARLLDTDFVQLADKADRDFRKMKPHSVNIVRTLL